jgi:hypothetical protein
LNAGSEEEIRYAGLYQDDSTPDADAIDDTVGPIRIFFRGQTVVCFARQLSG